MAPCHAALRPIGSCGLAVQMPIFIVQVPVDMKGKLCETRSSVHAFARRGDVKKTKFPTKQANRNLKGALCKNVQIIPADCFVGRSAMSTRTWGASPPGPPLIFRFTPPSEVLQARFWKACFSLYNLRFSFGAFLWSSQVLLLFRLLFLLPCGSHY